MNLPKPVVGLVINYSYLWHHEHARGFHEGFKDRPCAIVLTVHAPSPEVTILGITHTAPSADDHALEIPASVKRRLGLDDKPSWIVTTEANVFTWPGPDLRPRNPDDQTSIAYGFLPGDVVLELRRRVGRHAVSGHIRVVKRTE